MKQVCALMTRGYPSPHNEDENENTNEVRGKGKVKENMNLLIFVTIALDLRYKLSNYTKLAIGEMFGEEKGDKVWDTVIQCFYNFLKNIEACMLQMMIQWHKSMKIKLKKEEGG
jgi:hypothetical protein